MINKYSVSNYDLPSLFKLIAQDVFVKTGQNKLLFLTEHFFDRNFYTCYSTHGARLCFSWKELDFLLGDNPEEIIYPLLLLRNYSFYRRIFSKICWKIRRHRINAIVPVYEERNIICLIVFVGRDYKDILINSYYQSDFQQKMNYCLKSVILYNQAVNRLIKKS